MSSRIVEIKNSLKGYFVEPEQKTNKAILIGVEIFGINDDMKDAAIHIADNGYAVLIIDFYHRLKPMISLGYSDPERQEGLALLRQLKREEVLDDVQQSITYLQNHYYDKICFLGFSSGGHIGYIASTLRGINGTAAFYPGWLTSSDILLSNPTPPVHFTKDIQCPIMIIAGENDTLVTPAILDAVEQEMKRFNIVHQIVRYPGVAHGFLIAARKATYNQSASEDSWRRVLQFFDSTL